MLMKHKKLFSRNYFLQFNNKRIEANLSIVSLIVIFVLFSGYICLAQEFASQDTKWVFDYNGAWSIGITEIEFEKDTLINGLKTRKFSKKASRVTLDNRKLSFDLDPIYFRSDSGIVEYSEDGQYFDTLFNFNAVKGRSWKIYRHQGTMRTDSMEMVIVDTFITRIAGMELFSQAVYYGNLGLSPGIDTIYNFIGARWSYLLPFDVLDVRSDGGEGGIIRCFKNDKLGLIAFDNMGYGSEYKTSCKDLSMSNSIDQLGGEITISPNPINDFVEIFANEKCSFQIMTSLGDVIYNGNLNKGNNNFENISLLPGIYFLTAQGIYLKN